MPAASRPWWLAPLCVVGAGLLLTIPFWTGDLDLAAARWLADWNAAQGGHEEQRWWWVLAYHLPPWLALAIGLGASAAMVHGLRRPGSGAFRPGLFVLLVLIIGSGLVSNAILKDHWGRPRPRDTAALGGAWEYRAPWHKGVAGRGKSFPCGHATVPAALIAFWLLWRRTRPRLAWAAFAACLALTAYIGLSRMLEQAHWLSDVWWAMVIMALTALLLHRLLIAAPPAWLTDPARWPRAPALAAIAVAMLGLGGAALLATPFYRELAFSAGADELGPGPWRLEVEAADGAVTIDLVPGRQPALAVEGSARGFGLPTVRVRREARAEAGLARVQIAIEGLTSERVVQLRLAADPAQLAGIRIDGADTDVLIHAPPAVPPPALALRTRGRVQLPAHWPPP